MLYSKSEQSNQNFPISFTKFGGKNLRYQIQYRSKIVLKFNEATQQTQQWSEINHKMWDFSGL